MEVEKLGEEFIDGEILNLDNSSVDIYENALNKIGLKKEKIVKQINNILKKI